MSKRTTSLVLTIIVLSAYLSACTKPSTTLNASELLNLGEKHLIELNYEQAVVQFTKLIEIEPMNARAYTGLAEAYIGLGNVEKAIEALRQGLVQLPGNIDITAMLEKLMKPQDGAVISDNEQSEQMLETVPETMPKPDSEPVVPLINILADMSKAERTALHTFFSNFSEAYLNEFDANNYSVNTLIDFALYHNYYNYFKRFTYTDDYKYLRIAENHIEQAIYRFFGITNIDHMAYSSDWHYYRNDSYYLAGADGEPLYWSQVTYFADNGDGTFTAQYDVYASHEPPENRYDDITDWRLNGIYIVGKDDPYESGDVWEACVYGHSCIAVVAPHDYNGKQTYKLLHLAYHTT